jgi:hypothetical protein
VTCVNEADDLASLRCATEKLLTASWTAGRPTLPGLMASSIEGARLRTVQQIAHSVPASTARWEPNSPRLRLIGVRAALLSSGAPDCPTESTANRFAVQPYGTADTSATDHVTANVGHLVDRPVAGKARDWRDGDLCREGNGTGHYAAA